MRGASAMHDGRRLVYSPMLVQTLLASLQARADAAMLLARDNAELRAEVESLRKEIDELREVAMLLVAIERQRTEGDLDSYRRQLEAGLVKLTRRDPSMPLH